MSIDTEIGACLQTMPAKVPALSRTFKYSREVCCFFNPFTVCIFHSRSCQTEGDNGFFSFLRIVYLPIRNEM